MTISTLNRLGTLGLAGALTLGTSAWSASKEEATPIINQNQEISKMALPTGSVLEAGLPNANQGNDLIGSGGGELATSATQEALSYGSIPPGGLSIYPGGSQVAGLRGPNSNTTGSQPDQLCKVYGSLTDFTTDHGSFARTTCAADACLEDFECTPNAAAATLACTSNADLDCTGASNCSPNPSLVVGCTGAPALVKGLGIRENFPNPQIPAQAGTVALLQLGPNWFRNPTKYVGNNFITDALLIKFLNVPAACASGNPLPKVAGFNLYNYTTIYTTTDIVTVNLTGGKKFVYEALGDGSGRYFTGVCCTDGIESIEIASRGWVGEGLDNLRFGKGSTCAVPKVQTTANELSDQIDVVLKAIKAIPPTDLTPVNLKLDVLEVKLDGPTSGPTSGKIAK